MKKETVEEFLARGGNIKLCASQRVKTKKINSFGRRNNNTIFEDPSAVTHTMTYDTDRKIYIVRDSGGEIVFEGNKMDSVDYVNATTAYETHKTQKNKPTVKKSKAYYHYDAKLDKFVVKKRGQGKINRLFTGTKEECYNFIVDYNKKL